MLPENYTTLAIIQKYGAMISNGMGGINSHAIEMALKMEQIPLSKWGLETEKLLIYLTTIMNMQAEDNKD